MMGYGLTDLQCDKDGEIIDPRVNPRGWLGKSADDQEEHFTVDRFYRYCSDLIEPNNKLDAKDRNHDLTELSLLMHNHQPFQLWDCIKHDSEFGLPNVLCIIPPECIKSWVRKDTSLDYYMSAMNLFPAQGLPWVKEYEHNFYPYNGYIDTATDSRIVNPKAQMANIVYRNTSSEGIWSSQNIECRGKLSDGWAILDCDTTDEVKQRYVRYMPMSIRTLALYTKLFNDPKTVYQLKPIIYSFWS
jgi:hypothetical protein